MIRTESPNGVLFSNKCRLYCELRVLQRLASCASLPPKYNGETLPKSHNLQSNYCSVFLRLLKIDERLFASIHMRHLSEETVLSFLREFAIQKRFRKGKRTSCKTRMNFRISDSVNDIHKGQKQQTSLKCRSL